MMAPGDTLVLADGNVMRELRAQSGPSPFASCADPYEALLELGRRPWTNVVLTVPRAQLDGLCRAVRRLQKSARVVALCAPATEPEMIPLTGKVIDDYMIYPPTRQQWLALVAPPEPPPAPQATAGETPGLSPQDISELITAATSGPALEAKAAELVQRRLNVAVKWTDVNVDDPAPHALLACDTQPPRAMVAADDLLVPDSPASGVLPAGDIQPSGAKAAGHSPAAQAVLGALGQLLPALFAAARRVEALHRLAVTDPLTGAYNRRYFFHLTEQILRRSKDKPARITMLLYDIDNFKTYNDKYGHGAGDEVLKEIAALMKRTTRSQDIVARIGGDEFAILFWDAQPPRSPDSLPPESAFVLAERFRKAVNSHQFPALGPDASGVLTISGGLAAFGPAAGTCDELLRLADAALIAGKHAGKNAIHLVGPE